MNAKGPPPLLWLASRSSAYVDYKQTNAGATAGSLRRAKAGGSERIRTSETLAGLPVFKTGPIGHSGTLPYIV